MAAGNHKMIICMVSLLTMTLLLFQGYFDLYTVMAEAEEDESQLLQNEVMENEEQTTMDVPGSRSYPQQDGGSDDRLFEYRSMWLEGYQMINHSEVLKVIKVARDSNINCLTPLINGHSLGNFYNSSYHPRYRDLSWDFDPLMDLIREAHKYNIHIMPWFHTMYDYYAVRNNPEWGVVSSTGYQSTAYMNPALPQVRSYLSNVTCQLFRDYPLDGIHFDTLRYPGSNYGYGDYSIQKYTQEEWTSFTEFRKQQITDVVSTIYDNISSIRPYAFIGADIGSSSWRETSWFQDTDRWSELGKIDFVTPMTYTLNSEYLETITSWNVDVHSCPVVCGNYVYVPEDPYYGTVPDEETGIEILLNQTERARKVGTMGTCFFAYKFLAEHPKYHTALREGVFSEKALCPMKNQTMPVKKLRWEFEKDHDRMGWRTTDMGQHYPYEGVWSISNVMRPALMSPLINISADDINVLEISMRSETTGTVDIFWSYDQTVFTEEQMVSFPIKDTGDWHLYSLHLDDSDKWKGQIRYIRLVPNFSEKTNITIDLISLQWMPRCIKNWAYLGPFFNGKDEELLDRKFIDNEGSGYPSIGDVVSGKVWSGYEMDRDLVDYRFLFGHLEHAVTYAHVYAISDRDRDLQLRVGSSDGIIVWVNGEKVISSSMPRRVQPDLNSSMVHLESGINSILVKLANYRNEFSYYIRLTEFGEQTVDDIELIYDLPPLSPPLITFDRTGWISDPDIEVRWDQLEEERPAKYFEWKVDGSEYVITSNKSATLSNLSEGSHEFYVRSCGEIGKHSKLSHIEFNIDRQIPVISEPRSRSNISLSGSIEWKWEIINEPLSGITGFIISVERWRPSGQYLDDPVDGVFTKALSFTLDSYILDGYSYVIKVTSISGSGVEYFTRSGDPVLSDITPPTRPKTVTIEHRDEVPMTYLLKWGASFQHYNSTVNLYEVFKRGASGTWSLSAFSGTTSIIVNRAPGEKLAFKVRGVDDAGQRSAFSDVVENVNIPPIPVISCCESYIEGDIFHISGIGSYDKDGRIISYRWSLDGVVLSSLPVKNITLGPGKYVLELEVWDDLASSRAYNTTLNLYRQTSLKHNGSITEWLLFSSRKVEQLPVVNISIYDNNTIQMIDEVGEEEQEMIKDTSFLTFFVTIFTLGIISFLIMIGIIATSEIISFKVDRSEMEPSHTLELKDMEKKIINGRKNLIFSLNRQRYTRTSFDRSIYVTSDDNSNDNLNKDIRSTAPPLSMDHVSTSVARAGKYNLNNPIAEKNDIVPSDKEDVLDDVEDRDNIRSDGLIEEEPHIIWEDVV